jgi:hypothetical protein
LQSHRRRARDTEEVENQATSAGDILDGVDDHLDGLYGWMKSEFIHPVVFAGSDLHDLLFRMCPSIPRMPLQGSRRDLDDL